MNAYLNLLKTHPKALCYGFSHSFFSSFGQTFFIAFYVGYIQDSLNISNTKFGSLYALATVVGSFTLSHMGEWLDKTSAKSFSFFVLTGLICACLLLGLSTNLWILTAGLLLIRLFGQGLSSLVGSTTMAKLFKKNRGKALAISGLGHPLGEMILPSLAALLFTYFSWRETWFVNAGIIFVLFGGLILFFGQNLKGEIELPSAKTKLNRLQLIFDKRFFLLIPTSIMNAFVLTGVFFHQSFILKENGWSLKLMATAFIAFGVSRFIFSLVSGDLIDRISSFKLIKFYLIPLLLGVLSLLVIKHPAGAFLYLFLCGISVGFSSNLFANIWSEIYGVEKLGAVRGLHGTFGVFSTAVSPPLLGFMIDRGVSLQGFVFTLVMIIFASYSLLFFHPHVRE